MNFKPLIEFLDNYVPMLGIPGSDTVVFRNHEEIFRHTTGYDDIQFGTPMRKDALYNMYSITKLSLATAAMQLIERGEIMLNDPLYAYFPEYRDVTVKDWKSTGECDRVPAKSPILIKHLLTMTAGFNYNTRVKAIQDAEREANGSPTTLDIVSALAAEPLDFHPGESFRYSLCHDVMGGVIEVATGMKLGEYMKKYIFEPLGMNNTGFERTPEIFDRVAEQYQKNKDGSIVKMDKTKNFSVFGDKYESGGAGLISTVDDQILLADALASRGVGRTGERILSSFAVDLLHRNAIEGDVLLEFERTVATGGKQGYGYGLGVRVNINPQKSGNIAPLSEFGWDGAMGSYVLADTTTGISVFHAEHVSGFSSHPMVHPRLRNLVFSCIGE